MSYSRKQWKRLQRHFCHSSPMKMFRYLETATEDDLEPEELAAIREGSRSTSEIIGCSEQLILIIRWSISNLLNFLEVMFNVNAFYVQRAIL